MTESSCSATDIGLNVLLWGFVAFCAICIIAFFIDTGVTWYKKPRWENFCNREDHKLCDKEDHSRCKMLDITQTACDNMTKRGYKVKMDIESTCSCFRSYRMDSAVAVEEV